MLTITINASANYAHSKDGSNPQVNMTVAQAEADLRQYAMSGRKVSIKTNDSRERIAKIGGAK